jgi:hypothetical protein
MKIIGTWLLPYLVIVAPIFSANPGNEKAPNLNPVTVSQDPWALPEQQGDIPQAPSPTPSQEWSYHKTTDGSHPDANEQQMMWLMNRARSNPEQEGIWLADGTGQSNVTFAMSYFKVDKDVLKAEFAAIAEAPPGAFDSRVYQGSLDHSNDLIARDAQDHKDQFVKIQKYFSMNGGSASVYSYSKDPVHAHAGFNIDWGGNDGTGMQSGRGHRRALMDTGSGSSLSNVGIAMVADNNNSNNVGPLVTSIGYVVGRTSTSNHYNRFIVGTIWTDANGNDLYDAGEGHGGVSVIPDRGNFLAVTGDAGGFSIPATETGTYTITVSGGAVAQPQQRQVEVGSVSVLMIWNQADTWDERVPLVIPEAPEIRMELVSGQTRVAWEELGGLKYQLRQSDNLITWQNDNRTIQEEGNAHYFVLTQSDILSQRFFNLLVTAE